MEKKNYIPSFLVAYLLSISALNKLLGIALNKGEGVMIINLIPVAALLFIHFYIADTKKDRNLNKKALLFVYYIVSIIVVSKYAAFPNSFPYRQVLVYCFIPIYISFYKIDTEKVLKYMIFLSLLILPFFGDFFSAVRVGKFETIGMGTTYSILSSVIAAILHFFYYRKNAGFVCKIGYIINAIYLVKIITLGNRGPIVTLLVAFVLLVLRTFDKNDNLKANKVKNIVIILAVGIAAITIVNNLEHILFAVQKLLKSFDIEISAIDKSITHLRKGDFSNGREHIYKYTIDRIKENWLLGHGVCTFLYNSMGLSPYPHNLFLQMWYDLGVIISAPILIILIRACRKTIFHRDIKKNNVVFLILLFVISIPQLCYSGEFWTEISFWLLLMMSISPNIYETEKITETEYGVEENG